MAETYVFFRDVDEIDKKKSESCVTFTFCDKKERGEAEGRVLLGE